MGSANPRGRKSHSSLQGGQGQAAPGGEEGSGGQQLYNGNLKLLACHEEDVGGLVDGHGLLGDGEQLGDRPAVVARVLAAVAVQRPDEVCAKGRDRVSQTCQGSEQQRQQRQCRQQDAEESSSASPQFGPACCWRRLASGSR